MDDLREDRNKNRAHYYENMQGSARMLDLDDLRDLFVHIDQVINDLCNVGGLGTMGVSDMNHGDTEETASDLVDLILLGSVAEVAAAFAHTPREKFYETLHALHDPTGDKLVNDPVVVWELRNPRT